MVKKLTLFDGINAVFDKTELPEKVLKSQMYMIIRFLSMHPQYTRAMNDIQKYQGVLQHRLMILLQHLFAEAKKAPFLDYVKKQEQVLHALSEKSRERLAGLFNVSKRRLKEYEPNLYVSDDEVKSIWGDQK